MEPGQVGKANFSGPLQYEWGRAGLASEASLPPSPLPGTACTAAGQSQKLQTALARDWQSFFIFYFFCKDPVNILGFVEHTVSVAVTQLCRCSVKAAIDK